MDTRSVVRTRFGYGQNTAATHRVELRAALSDVVGDDGGISKGRNIFADLVEGDEEVFGVHTRELALALVSENDNLGVGIAGCDESASVLGNRGVDTTAETTVARNDNNELLAFLGRSGSLEDL